MSMNYYEELGLDACASDAEIKKSYKRLTLLLHPDQHLDPQIRALAETQMKRLNEIISVLTNPKKRYLYNKQLLEHSVSVLQKYPIYPLLWLWNNRGWLVVGVVFLASALLILRVAPPAGNVAVSQLGIPNAAPRKHAAEFPDHNPAVQSNRTATPPNVSTPRADGASHPSPRPTKTAAQSAGAFQTSEVEAPPPDMPVSLPQVLSAPPFSLPVPPLDKATILAAGQQAPEIRTLSGKWVYAPDPHDPPDALVYPADYVELTLTVNAGVLRGNYRSRYRLSDRILSPYANFIFHGPANGTTFVWQGNADSQGEVTLRLQASDTLQVIWFATKMGSQLSLGSGKATVYRVR